MMYIADDDDAISMAIVIVVAIDDESMANSVHIHRQPIENRQDEK
jgi:hypothetical protein